MNDRRANISIRYYLGKDGNLDTQSRDFSEQMNVKREHNA